MKWFEDYCTLAALYSFFTNRRVRITVIIITITILSYCFYKNYHDMHANGDITLKYETNTENLTPKEIKEYLEKNKFYFSGGNPLEFTNFSIFDDGVAFKRFHKNDNIEYLYCNAYVYSLCIDTSIKISDLDKYFKKDSDAYNSALNIYNDYNKKLKQLNLTEEQVRSVLDYYYEEIKSLN